jgi:uncharacterized protein YdeI (YjbR/CyaY-like superfamily)
MAKQIKSETGYSFKLEKDFEKWLSKNHSTSTGIWVYMYKKDSGIKAISNAELIDTLLCYGWITGPAKKENDNYILWWVCQRKHNSLWSKLNMKHAERLIKEKRMKPSGMAEIEKAKANGQWHI